jgi:hypothetical protein
MEAKGQFPCRFTPGEKAPGIHYVGDWVGPRAGPDMKNLLFLSGTNLFL